MLSRLMTRQLPESLLEALDQENIMLFPKEWDDLDASCNCPDRALPCKHLAAGIYLMANRIDHNPFLVFESHGFDLLAAIEKLGLLQLTATQTAPNIKHALNKPSSIDDDYHSEEALEDIWKSIDFSVIPDVSDRLDTLLKPSPLFYSKDFKQLFFTALKQGKRYADKILHEKSTRSTDEDAFHDRFGHTENWAHLHLIINDRFQTHKLYNQEGLLFDNGKAPRQKTANAPIESVLVDLLTELPNARLHQHCHTLRFLYLLNQFVIKLISQQAIIPELCQSAKEEYIIRWLPALFDESINQQFLQLAALCPEQWLSFKTKTAFLTRYQQTLTTCSLLLIAHLRHFQPPAIEKLIGEPVIDLFFTGTPETFSTFQNQEHPNTIHQWLSRLTTTRATQQLQLLIKEKDLEFSIHLQVTDSQQKRRAIALNTFMGKTEIKHDDAGAKVQILSDLALLCEYMPDMAAVIDNPRSSKLTFHFDDFSPILLHILPALKTLGMQVVLPKALQKLIKPSIKLRLSSEESADTNQGYMNLDELLTFDWAIAIGDKTVDIQTFRQMLQDSLGLVRLMDQYVLLDEADMQQLLKQLDKLPETLSSAELLQAALGNEYHGADVQIDQHIQQLLDNLSNYKPVKIPKNLNATLRPYQKSGFSWMVQNTELGFGSLIADDMGLGKTLQVIATLLHYKNTGKLDNKKALIVAPTTLLTNWQKEVTRFAPSLNVHVYHGQERSLNPKNDFDILITSYCLARRDKNKLNQSDWFILVIDEAQNIKNPKSAQSKSIKGIKANYRIAMSGTPVENRLMEYWSIFDFTNKNYLGNAKTFKEYFANPIEKERDHSCLERFQKVTGPFILRRLKSDKSIIQDLPDKIEADQICHLSSEQTALYQEVVNLTLNKIEASKGIERKGLIFQLINALKQICNHPAQYLKTKTAEIDQSGKLQSTIDLLSAIDEQSEKTLIFTQYKQMGDLLAQVLENTFHREAPFLHGGLSIKKRDQLVQDFQNEPQVRTMIVSLKAGGTGLNLTAANHIIHYDLWWNPAVEAQATDRAYRIGQKKNVMVHRLLTENTFEEKINDMLKEKKDLANLSVASGETWLTEFDDKQLKSIFSGG